MKLRPPTRPDFSRRSTSSTPPKLKETKQIFLKAEAQ